MAITISSSLPLLILWGCGLYGRGSQSVTPALIFVASFESVSFKFGDRLLKLKYVAMKRHDYPRSNFVVLA